MSWQTGKPWTKEDHEMLERAAGILTAKEIGGLIGRSHSAIRTYCSEQKISLRVGADDATVDMARQLYEDEGLTMRAVAEKLEVSFFTVREWLRYRVR